MNTTPVHFIFTEHRIDHKWIQHHQPLTDKLHHLKSATLKKFSSLINTFTKYSQMCKFGTCITITILNHHSDNSIIDEFFCLILFLLFLFIEDSPYLINHNEFLVELLPREGHRFVLKLEGDCFTSLVENAKACFFCHNCVCLIKN